jgi:hypothetical protein
MTAWSISLQQGLDLTDRRLGLALELAAEIQDFPRHLATHVGGFVMSRGLLTEMAIVGNALASRDCPGAHAAAAITDCPRGGAGTVEDALTLAEGTEI